MKTSSGPSLLATDLVLLWADIAGFARAFASHDDLTMARVIDRYYGLCTQVVEDRGGRVVKFIGDACHAVFPTSAAPDAVATIVDLRDRLSELRNEFAVAVELGANLHSGTVIEGEFGPADSKRYDVIGREMNYTAMMGRGPGLRISEPVYSRLSAGDRAAWRERDTPGTYAYAPDS